MSVSFLKTKLIIPLHRPSFVLRPRLVASLEEGQLKSKNLTLVSAKAGSGKTTLISEWIHRQSRPTAWLSLDSNDNDPIHFFNYLTTALNELGIKTNSTLLGHLENAPLPAPEELLSELVNQISAPLLVVFDDYHLIKSEWIHQAVDFLVEHIPPSMHLICITRVDPPLPLARLRAHGQLVEIRDNDLKFTEDEATQFFNEAMGLNLPTDAVSTLEVRTEGWIAGLQLAAISIKGRQRQGDPSAFISAFSGSNRFILDYLMEEVLNQQTDIIQDFLMDTAILNRMCADLCDAVRYNEEATGEKAGSQYILEQLERANLFVIPLDDERHWYRYHHLFADLLTSTLRKKKSEAQVSELHRRASRWYYDQSCLVESMQHAIAAENYEWAASLIDENLASMFSRSEVPVLLRWIEKLPKDVVQGRPWIEIHRANTLVISGRPEEAIILLDEIEKRITLETDRYSELLGHIAAIRAYAANLSGDTAQAIEMAELAIERLPANHIAGRGTAIYTLADTYSARDDLERASQVLLEMVKMGEKMAQLMILMPALSDLAMIRIAQGRLHQAKELLDQAYQWLVDHNGLETRLRCSYEFGMAELLREKNQLDIAYKHALLGDEYRKRHGGYLMVGDLTLMRIYQARGDAHRALEVLRTAEQIMEAHQFQLKICTEFKIARVLQWLAIGDLDKAAQWAEECTGGTEREKTTLARLWLAQGQIDEAQQVLTPLSEAAEDGGRNGRLIEIHCLQALVMDAQDHSEQALNLLTKALSIAQPEGFVRTFLDLGDPLVAILKQVAAQGNLIGKASIAESLIADYARQLVATDEDEDKIELEEKVQNFISPLTEREIEVLRWLSEGLTNKAIAEKLVVAPSTVKQHLKNIYNKLNAHNRTEAVAIGRQQELL